VCTTGGNDLSKSIIVLIHETVWALCAQDVDVYFYKDSPNPYLHKFARCALTDISVEYGGEQFVTFEDGSPVEIGMTLTFQELEQMTSEGVERYGY
jgi:hypothetical protein